MYLYQKNKFVLAEEYIKMKKNFSFFQNAKRSDNEIVDYVYIIILNYALKIFAIILKVI